MQPFPIRIHYAVPQRAERSGLWKLEIPVPALPILLFVVTMPALRLNVYVPQLRLKMLLQKFLHHDTSTLSPSEELSA